MIQSHNQVKGLEVAVLEDVYILNVSVLDGVQKQRTRTRTRHWNELFHRDITQP